MRRLLPSALWCLLLAAVALALAAVDPGFATHKARRSWYAVFDISQSMNVRDAALRDSATGAIASRSPSRLERASEALRVAVARLPCGTRMGIGVFVERESQILLEPVDVCRSRLAIDDVAVHLDSRMAWSADSFVHSGFWSAWRQAQTLDDKPGLLFFSDWDQAPRIDPARIAAPPADFKPDAEPRPVLLVGLGRDQPQPVPKLGERGRIEGFWQPSDTAEFASSGPPPSSPSENGLPAMRDDYAADLSGSPRNAGQRSTFRGVTEHLSARSDGVRHAIAASGGFDEMTIEPRGDNPGIRLGQWMNTVRASAGTHLEEVEQSLRDPLMILGFVLLIAGFLPARALSRRRRASAGSVKAAVRAPVRRFTPRGTS